MTIHTSKNETRQKVKRKSKIAGLLWILPVILITALLVIAALDTAGLRTAALQMIQGNSAVTPDPSSELEAERKKLEDERNRLTLWDQQLAEKQESLVQREESIAAIEEETRRLNEEAMELKGKLSAQFDELMEVVVLYEKMDAERAARILELMGDRNMAVTILKNMKKEKASAVLEEMTPQSAAEFTKLMLY